MSAYAELAHAQRQLAATKDAHRIMVQHLGHDSECPDCAYQIATLHERVVQAQWDVNAEAALDAAMDYGRDGDEGEPYETGEE